MPGTLFVVTKCNVVLLERNQFEFSQYQINSELFLFGRKSSVARRQVEPIKVLFQILQTGKPRHIAPK